MPYINEPIAVIGSGCRFPGSASNPSKLWGLLRDPKDVQRRIDRFRADNFHNDDGHYHGAANVQHAYLLDEDTKKFDARFFNIPLSEAEAIDPQQRLLMEAVFESLDGAGLSMEDLSGSNTAAYVGVMCDDFSQIVYGDSENIPTYAATGSARSILSNRISYFFNWHGPSMTIDTACSSSLIAVHQAVQALRSGESNVAIASGTNLIFGPTMFVAESNLNMLSPTGRSRMWDAGANGYARGEGVASVVMKKLSDAVRDGDDIEYIIRETGINQDGRTPGITMPSSESQARLIRDTYAKAGLDPLKADERCQYFEAHGTGTQAGDGQEAAGIYEAFFSHMKKSEEGHDEIVAPEDVLHVGSIKTIVGHTEGTAGIAGLMKAALAIQNKSIPPNMLFTKLNPKLQPYYNHLKIPLHLRDWPETANGVRRASVNSFGFGGANAHAIIESYEPEIQLPDFRASENIKPTKSSTKPEPHLFVFSAASLKSLAALLQRYVTFLDENPTYDMDDLFWTLFRRTAHSFRTSFTADSVESLREKLLQALEDSENKKSPLGVRVSPKTPQSILGVFTGQGAQWATMGRHLVQTSSFAESIIDDLEDSLSELPADDVPEWSLKAELLKSKEDSRISEGIISQPLCTAVQVMVIQLLRQAGINFKSVVGHSSGEIACAYVSGFISAQDAIRIAYYRGKFTPLAKATAGAMIAVGTDMQDAIDMTSLPKLKSKAQLAASNSSASVTISGDAAAIDLVEIVSKDEGKFARKLNVDTAYHSHHMAVCSKPYIEALNRCGVKVQEPSSDACSWYTSVSETNEKVTMNMASILKDQYWSDNMLQPVLFSQALTAAVTSEGTPGVTLEVGPHPALKGPASLTIEELVGPVPYFGTLARGQLDSIALMNAIGSIWSVLGSTAVPGMRDLQRAYSGETHFSIAKDLPTYAWDHEKAIWNETRVSKAHRLRANAKHELLGVREVNEGEGERRWRNYLKPKEMPWLRGHQIHGQMVFPAAGYAVMALEAVRTLAPFNTIRLMELQKFSIHKAISFMDDNANIETLFSLSEIHQSPTNEDGEGSVTAKFACYACMNKESGEFTSMASGAIKMDINSESAAEAMRVMPERRKWVNNFVSTDVEYFYECLNELGYGYQGMFQGVTNLWRTNGGSKGLITIPQDESEEGSMPQGWVIHPATLDVAFQAVFAAVGAPGDGRLWTLHVPTMIDSIAVNPRAYQMSSAAGVSIPLPFDAFVDDSDQLDGIAGDVDLYDEETTQVIVQVQGLHVTPLTRATDADDRETFASISWGLAAPDLVTDWLAWTQSEDDEKVSKFAERLSLCILRDLCDSLPTGAGESYSDHQRHIIEWAGHTLEKVRAREHPTCLKEWLSDTWELLEAPAQRLAKTNSQIRDCLTIKEYLALLMANSLAASEERELRGSFSGNEMPGNGMLGFDGYQAYTTRLAHLCDQLSFKHRNMRVLEVTAGNGHVAKKVLDVLGQNFSSYTFTDSDSSHFDQIRSQVSQAQSERVYYKTLNLEQNIVEQEFVTGYYDLIIASNALHTVPELEETLKQLRTLVRPGGYMVLLEPTKTSSLAIGLRGCLSAGWFVGIEDERKFSPFITQEKWDESLRTAGFSGLDTATPEEFATRVPYSIMCSMAVDKLMDVIRDPLSNTAEATTNIPLLIIGGKTVHTRNLVRDLKRTLGSLFSNVLQAETVLDVSDEMLDMKPATISLVEMDELLFKPFTEEKFKAIVKICDNMQTMLWITIGSRGENPYMNMMVAVGRCLVGEMPNMRLQFLNFDGSDRPTSNVVAHHLLQLHLSSSLSGESFKPNEPLYLIERELTIQNGTLLVPRYLPVDVINNRLNSDKRVITKEVDQSLHAVAVDGLLKLRQGTLPDFTGSSNVKVSVSKSLLNAVTIGSSFFHLMIGSVCDSDGMVMALSQVNQSIVSVPRSQIIELSTSDIKGIDEATMLSAVGSELSAMAILENASGSILVHEPMSGLSKSLQGIAAAKGINLVMTSVSTSRSIDSKGVNGIHSNAPDRALTRIIPKDISVFVDLSTGDDTIGARLRHLVPRHCQTKNSSHIFSREAFVRDNETGINTVLQFAIASTRKLGRSSDPAPVLSASAIASLESSFLIPYLQIIDWKLEATLPVSLRPADESMRFRNDRTYFLVGLTGELGLQLTKWMVRRGAKYFALSSRNPHVDGDWLELMESEGAIINLYAMDVTSRSSVRATHRQISVEMPPVAGVMNGAMILIDGLFANKTHAEFEKTLRPKVEGTVYLDEVYNSKDLDFFIVFSSLACVSGNMGQTAYAAANAFMCSLVAGRRLKGLAGSAINMPGIVGLGYLNRDTRKLDRLKNLGYVNISEWDFYQFLSEAIVAGRPDSGMIPEITAGLKKLQVEGADNLPLWSKTPRFHWLRIPVSSVADNSADSDNADGGASVRSRLTEMTTKDEVRDLLLEGLMNTLYTRLNMSPSEGAITRDTVIVQLGVDSLLAVDMRSWFTKELDLDMPVLKILGGATVEDLIDDAISRMSPELVPNMAGASGEPTSVESEEQNSADGADPASEDRPDDTVETEPEEATSADDLINVPETLKMLPIDLPDFDELSSDIEASGMQSSRYQSTIAGDLDKSDQQSESTNPTSHSDASSDYVKVEANEESSTRVAAPGDQDYRASAKLFSKFQDTSAEALQHNFQKKVPMSYGTSRFYFLMQYLRDPTTFNLLCHVKFTGNIRFDDADRCIAELGNRHEVFRTAFFADTENLNEPTMGIMEKSHLHLERRLADSEADVDAEGEELIKYDFKIDQGETIRMKMISLPDSTHHLLFGFHHIILDGFSFNLLLAELNPLYDGETLEPVKTTFSEFAVQQRQKVADGSLDAHFQYWKDVYSTKNDSGEVKPDFPEPLPLFSLARSPRRSLDVYEFHESSLVLDSRTNRQIKAQCKKYKITPFHFFLSVLRVFLNRHLGADDLVIGIADANRVDSALDSTVGFMLNLLPLRFKNGENGSQEDFKDIAQTTRDTVYDALGHSALPFDALLERLDVPRSATHSPLFQAWMDYRPIKPGNRPTLFGSEANGTQTVGRNAYDLTLDITELDDSEPRVSFRTQRYMYSEKSTQMLFDSYMRLVRAFATKFASSVDSIPLWSPKDIEVAKNLGQGPSYESDWPETVSHRINEMAFKNPKAVAVKDDRGGSVTYEDLLQRVQHISNSLSSLGVKQSSRVAVFQEPTSDWICSLLAIWHVGATYIPLDLRIAESLSRLALITHTAKPAAILCHDNTAEKVPELHTTASIINVSKLSKSAIDTTPTQARATSAATILFTSGSTGVPKGVILPHKALKNTFEGLTKQYGIGSENVLQQSAYTFDFSLDQMVIALANAGSVYVVSKENRSDSSAIAKIIKAENITYTRATPSEYTSWLAHGGDCFSEATKWKFAWAGGELLPPSVVERISHLELPNLKLFNSYGPAETITCTKGEVQFELSEDEVSYDEDVGAEQDNIIPVGSPLPNYSIFIVDHNLELLPQGAAGEVVIGGPSVGAGYLNDDKLSEKKFIGNAYGSDGSRIVYRTGDLGRLQTDGKLEFLGRMSGDTMVKIRGMRVDLQDIESSILSAADGALEKAVVSLRAGNLLVAHVQFAQDARHDDEAAQQALLRQMRFILSLPLYMIPAIFVPIAEMPTNAHGKTDRKATAELALPQATVSEGRYGAALSETERKLLQVWKEVIDTESNEVTNAIQVTEHTSFFELGGNSLLLVKLQMLISIRFNVKITLVELFSAASLSSMASKIESAPESAASIDWDKETALEKSDFEKRPQHISSQPQNKSNFNVLVTGATGFLGQKLLNDLAASDKVNEINCVAVRSVNKNSVKSTKIKTYTGDLAASRLGLSDTNFAALAAKTDIIIHAGVSRSLMDAYPLLRGADFESTKTLVRLAATRSIPFHYISSGSVESVDTVPSTTGADGYLAAKWASERYLGQASTKLDLPVTIHRIVTEPNSQVSTTKNDDLISHVRNLSSQMMVTPDAGTSGSELLLDFIRVDSVVTEMAKSVLQSRPSNDVSYLKYITEAQVSMADMVPAGLSLPSIPAMQWIAQARRSGFEWQLASMDNFSLGR